MTSSMKTYRSSKTGMIIGGIVIVLLVVLLVLFLLGYIVPDGCAADSSQAGFKDAEHYGNVVASGKNGDTRGDLGDSNGSLTLNGDRGVSGEYKLQDTLKNGRSWYKNANGCTIQHATSSPAEWEATCDGEVKYRSFFDTLSGPTDGWQAVKGVTTKDPVVELVSGVLVPEESPEELVRGVFVPNGLSAGRPSYKNQEGCQIYFTEAPTSAKGGSGEWQLMCWAEWCNTWLKLYKVKDDGIHYLPPLSGWEVEHGEGPAPTYAVVEPTDAAATKAKIESAIA